MSTTSLPLASQAGTTRSRLDETRLFAPAAGPLPKARTSRLTNWWSQRSGGAKSLPVTLPPSAKVEVAGTGAGFDDKRRAMRTARGGPRAMTQRELACCVVGDVLRVGGKRYDVTRVVAPRGTDPGGIELFRCDVPYETASKSLPLSDPAALAGRASLAGPDVLLHAQSARLLPWPRRVRFLNAAEGVDFSARCEGVDLVDGEAIYRVRAGALTAAQRRVLHKLGDSKASGFYRLAESQFVARLDGRDAPAAPGTLAFERLRALARGGYKIDRIAVDGLLVHWCGIAQRDGHEVLQVRADKPSPALAVLDPDASGRRKDEATYCIAPALVAVTAPPDSDLALFAQEPARTDSGSGSGRVAPRSPSAFEQPLAQDDKGPTSPGSVPSRRSPYRIEIADDKSLASQWAKMLEKLRDGSTFEFLWKRTDVTVQRAIRRGDGTTDLEVFVPDGLPAATVAGGLGVRELQAAQGGVVGVVRDPRGGTTTSSPPKDEVARPDSPTSTGTTESIPVIDVNTTGELRDQWHWLVEMVKVQGAIVFRLGGVEATASTTGGRGPGPQDLAIRLASDPEGRVGNAFGLRNPKTLEDGAVVGTIADPRPDPHASRRELRPLRQGPASALPRPASPGEDPARVLRAPVVQRDPEAPPSPIR